MSRCAGGCCADLIFVLKMQFLFQIYDKHKHFIDQDSGTNRDWVGPRDTVSNLRYFKFAIPADESRVEQEYREMRVDLQKWNHKFWTKHNLEFQRVSCG